MYFQYVCDITTWMDGWKDGWMVRNSRLEFLLRVVHTYIPKLLAAKLHTCKYVCSLRRSILVMRGNNMAPLGPVSALLAVCGLCCDLQMLGRNSRGNKARQANQNHYSEQVQLKGA